MSNFCDLTNEEAMKFANPDYSPEPEDPSLPVCFPPIPTASRALANVILGKETANQGPLKSFYGQQAITYIANGMKILERYGIETPLQKYESDIRDLCALMENPSRAQIEKIYEECDCDMQKAGDKILSLGS